MATLTAWKFDSPQGAAEAEQIVVGLSKQELIKVFDAATVEWLPGKKKPKTRQLNSLTGAGALGGSLADAGIDDDFIDSVKQKVTPGTSALFLLSADAVIDKVKDAFAGVNAELISTNLSDEDEAKLREAFAEED